jgi:hypothetical protein
MKLEQEMEREMDRKMLEELNEKEIARDGGDKDSQKFKFRQMVQVGAESFYLINENGDLLFMRASQYEREIGKVAYVKIEEIGK